MQAEQNRALAGVMAALDAGFATEAPDNKRKAAGTPAETDMAKRRRFLETLLEGDDSGMHPLKDVIICRLQMVSVLDLVHVWSCAVKHIW